jgi:hypothetical protein
VSRVEIVALVPRLAAALRALRGSGDAVAAGRELVE